MLAVPTDAMPHPYPSYCDDFYVNLRLGSQMPLPSSRDTVLHFFEQVQKAFPGMTRFRRGEPASDFCLEEDRGAGTYRWVSIEPTRVSAGFVNPPDLAAALQLHKHVLERLPYELGVSPVEVDYLDVLFGFDLEFAGNHDEVVADALFADSPLAALLDLPGSRPVDFQPSTTIALSEDLRLQARVDVVTRTNSYQVRTGDYSEEAVSVYLIVRRFWGDRPKESFGDVFASLAARAEELAASHVLPRVVRPLQGAIASRS